MWYADDHVAKMLTEKRRRLFVQPMGEPVAHSRRPYRIVGGPLVWLLRQGGCLLAGAGQRWVTLGSRLERRAAAVPAVEGASAIQATQNHAC